VAFWKKLTGKTLKTQNEIDAERQPFGAVNAGGRVSTPDTQIKKGGKKMKTISNMELAKRVYKDEGIAWSYSFTEILYIVDLCRSIEKQVNAGGRVSTPGTQKKERENEKLF
jgi:hypothetical protein